MLSRNNSESIDSMFSEELNFENKHHKQSKSTRKSHNRHKQLNTIKSIENLQEQPTSKNNQLQFECTFCHQHFKHELFNQHILSHISKVRRRSHKMNGASDRTYECYKCRHYSSKLSYIREHISKCSGPTEYQCDICYKSFAFPSSMYVHRTIHKEWKFQCEKCPKKFYRKKYLENHRISRHPDAKEYKFECFICRKPFAFKRYLELHLKMHAKKEVFKCEYCTYTYGSKCTKIRHIREHHPDKMQRVYECEFCKKKFKQKSLLHDHIRVQHHNRRQYECSICKKCFREKRHLKIHELIHGDKTIECIYCDMKFKKSDSLLYHEKTAHKLTRTFECLKCRLSANLRTVRKHMTKCLGEIIFECDICQMTFSTSRILERHKLCHFEKQFQCDECPQKFHREDSIKSHKRSRHSLVRRTEDFKCPLCNKQYLIAGHLIKHIQNIHQKILKQQHINVIDLLPDGITLKMRPFQCKLCSKILLDKYGAKKHEGIHMKPFKCEQCNHRCATEIILFNHIRRQHFMRKSKNVYKKTPVISNQCAQRSFECFICHLSYMHKSSLKTHFFQHDEKKYECNNCQRKFYTPGDLHQHKRIHLKLYKCKKCSFRFSSAYGLYSHVRKEHPDEIDPSNSSINPSDAVVELRFDRKLGVWT